MSPGTVSGPAPILAAYQKWLVKESEIGRTSSAKGQISLVATTSIRQFVLWWSLLPLLQYPVGVATFFEDILEGFESVLRWNLDCGSHDPVRGTARADVGSGLLSRESNPRAVNDRRMPATESETTREGGAFEDGYDSCSVVTAKTGR